MFSEAIGLKFGLSFDLLPYFVYAAVTVLVRLCSCAGSGFYTKLNVWGSLGLNFDYDGGPIFIYNKSRISEVSTSFREGILTGLSCQRGVSKHCVIFVPQPFVST